MTKEKGIPQIRFSGFTDTWEQRKLGDIASDMVAGGDIDKDLILAEGQYPVIANALTGDGIVGYYDKEYRVNAPAVTVTGRGDVGHAKARLVNFTPVVRLLSVKSEHDVFFLENVINTLKIVIESTGVPQLTVPQLAKYEVAFPRQLDEEEHIGAFFKQLDHLITLHQRKYDKLTKVKKAMLEKMFPKNGSLYPEIRFKGFTDAWEQRELGECFSERVESMPDGELISVTINDGIKKFSELGRHDNSNDDKSKYKKVCIGDIAYNSMRMWQGASGYSPYEGIVSPAYTVLSPNSNIYSKCVAYQFKLPQTIHIFQINSQGITSDNWNLKYPALSKIKINVSRSLEEQRLIAEFFTHLDRLITLHQRKLEKLKNIKKACLEKMFV